MLCVLGFRGVLIRDSGRINEELVSYLLKAALALNGSIPSSKWASGESGRDSFRITDLVVIPG